MRSLTALLIFLGFSIFSSFSYADVKTVSKVDLTRYIGKWYEIASIPHSFQKQCVGGVTAEYKDLGNGRVEVVNSCETKDGSRSVSEGQAKVVNTDSNAELKVTFVKLFGWIYAFGGDYWIIDLDKDYRYAVVGHPTRKYGWILSRTPQLDSGDLKNITQNLKDQGYDLCSLMMTVQAGGVTSRSPLCEYMKQ
ncbi:lipocalin family protein [Bdellovibrio sp. SKB1291214]|uniref:lipocalin family protein n=1 Tax=Bdellovibrio sp. SKB1291214 TaxID=1732569 RepID=UPI000B519179|nr:lipocalin family protein [Bdellovibrio sp. SKB1291214]UYL07847.1 lipocalin family protein [Bdellovibrio sp. SKB1291214]